MIEEIAPAKINLYLHVGPLRADGLHDLQSFFFFADDGDRLRVLPSSDLSLTINGPFADSLAGEPVESNLVFKAAVLLRETFSITDGAQMVLDKRLPVAAGIGGGSADAAAALRALVELWSINISEEALQGLAFQLGADVPACLSRSPVNVSGAGEVLSPGGSLPPLWVVLVNSRQLLSTGPVFNAFDTDNGASSLLGAPPQSDHSNIDDLKSVFESTRNDLEPFAIKLQPSIAHVLEFLASCEGVIASRMSGSGATCFALFSDGVLAQNCANEAQERAWWALSTKIATTKL